MLKKPILILKNVDGEEKFPILTAEHGDIDSWIIQMADLQSVDVEVVDVINGAKIPNAKNYRAIIISGSTSMVTERTDWIEGLAAWIREFVDIRVPILGICFGHQMLAYALGGKVGDNPNGGEWGTVSVSLFDLAKKDRVFGDLPKTLVVQAAHMQSVLKLPENAVSLAESNKDAYQIVRFCDWVWGIQFHPEIDAEIIRSILQFELEELTGSGVDVSAAIQSIEESNHGHLVFRQFLKHVDHTLKS
jgi:GMP synthase (glutamine-hydrolysing)